MIPALMSSHTDANLPLSPVVVNTSKPSIASANNERSRRGYTRPKSCVVRLTVDALALTNNNSDGTIHELAGKTTIEAAATIFLDIAG